MAEVVDISSLKIEDEVELSGKTEKGDDNSLAFAPSVTTAFSDDASSPENIPEQHAAIEEGSHVHVSVATAPPTPVQGGVSVATSTGSSTRISTRSTHSTQSRASISPYQITTAYTSRKLFSYKRGVIDSAVEMCKKSVIETEADGEIKGVWLLTDIDHWDHEREILILLTAKSLIAVKYDFITPAVKYFKRISLKKIESVEIGDLVYPDYSLMGTKDNGGLRIHWAKEDPWFYQRWNPWCSDVGYMTLTHHILIFNEKERETVTYNVSDLADSLIQAVGVVRREDGNSEPLQVKEGPVTIYSYASVSSLVYNQSHIGFNMDRGGMTF